MEMALKKDIYECMAPVWFGTASRETGEEYIVPDTMPDVGEIVDAEGVLTLRGKETESGYVQISVSAAVSVVYAPEDGTGLKSLELNLPTDIRMDAPEADGDCTTVARVRIRAIDARAVNSRKISVRAELEAEARCYRRDSVQIASAPAEPGNAHILEKTAAAMLVTDVREKTFAVTDEYEFPSGWNGDGVIISRRVEPVVEDVKYVGGKAVFRGRVRTELLFSDPGSGRAAAGRYETEFSQILETGDGEADALPDISLFLTGAYFDMPEYGRSEGKVQAEIHLAAQCVCRQKREMGYLADVYSNRTELVPVMETVPVLRAARAITVRQTVAGRAETAATDGEIVRVSASVRGITWEEGAVKTALNVRLLCRGADGKYFSARCRMGAEFTPAESAPVSRLQDISVSVADVYCQSLADDVRVTLRMDALALEEDSISCVSSVQEDAEAWNAREKSPSFTLVRVPAGTDMWTLARRYRSTAEAIAAINDGREEGLLLIPKAR